MFLDGIGIIPILGSIVYSLSYEYYQWNAKHMETKLSCSSKQIDTKYKFILQITNNIIYVLVNKMLIIKLNEP